jgi:hypothetical protein
VHLPLTRTAYAAAAQPHIKKRSPRAFVPSERAVSIIRMVERTLRHRRRPRRTPMEWVGPHPDRIASWAVAMGFLLVLAALLSAHG